MARGRHARHAELTSILRSSSPHVHLYALQHDVLDLALDWYCHKQEFLEQAMLPIIAEIVSGRIREIKHSILLGGRLHPTRAGDFQVMLNTDLTSWLRFECIYCQTAVIKDLISDIKNLRMLILGFERLIVRHPCDVLHPCATPLCYILVLHPCVALLC